MIALLALVLAGCARTPFQDLSGAIGTLSRGQISFGSVGFASANTPGYTTLFPNAQGIAKGLGSDDWAVNLEGTGLMYVACVNNGSNVPQGVFNFPINDDLASTLLLAQDRTAKNGKSPFTVSAGSGLAAWQALWETTDLYKAYEADHDGVVTTYCPNANYDLAVVGGTWNTVTIVLIQVGATTPADSVTYTCSDPANPSSETCTIQ